MSSASAAKTGGLSIKRILPRTLFGRSLVILVTPVLLIQIITTFVFFDRHWSKMTGRLAFAVAGEIAIIAKSIEDNPDSQAVERIMAFAGQNLDMLVRFKKGSTLESTGKEGYRSFWQDHIARTLLREMEAQLRRPFDLHIDFDEKWIHVSVQLSNGVLNVTLPQRRLFSSSSYIFLLWVFGTSLILLVIAIAFMRNQIRPIRKLAAAAERFGKGRDVVSFKPQGAREVRQAAEAFIDMHRRIRRQIEQRTAMLAGVSHDLRTPLTRLKLQLEMMDASADTQSMKEDIQQMEKMIKGYLDFVRGEGDEQAVMTDLRDMIERLSKVMSGDRVAIKIVMDEPVSLMLRPVSFERCLTNIISNATHYAKTVWISAGRDRGSVEIVIEDDGPGIPPAQFEEVFRPFYRMDASRNTATGGVGLGLPIAMDIVHGHGGKIWLEESEKGGLKVVIRLPV